jgi:hypothetical protein
MSRANHGLLGLRKTVAIDGAKHAACRARQYHLSRPPWWKSRFPNRRKPLASARKRSSEMLCSRKRWMPSSLPPSIRRNLPGFAHHSQPMCPNWSVCSHQSRLAYAVSVTLAANRAIETIAPSAYIHVTRRRREMAKILVLYYSMYNHIETLARGRGRCAKSRQYAS